MADRSQAEEDAKQTVKRDLLRGIEQNVQKKWDEHKCWEIDAPEPGTESEKFMAVFPYPYMNGSLHLGHSFTISKAEFMVGYQRHLGKKAIFPFAYHATGMPIKACADKLKREMETYGCPPQFPSDEEIAKMEEEKAKKKAAAANQDPTSFKSKKSKLEAKGATATFQWRIMQALGIPDEDIPKFADAAYWLNFFPPLAKDDVAAMGCKVDHRRDFITTDVNPYYDSFVSWQFRKLKDLGLCRFGKRFVIWSPLDNQPCADHDRASGEGVNPTEYTVVKMEVRKPFPEVLSSLEGKRVFFGAATLRPETMYGQTNCWILPDGEYGAFEIAEGEVMICSQRAAYNMAFQGNSLEYGKEKALIPSIKGQDLVGVGLIPPYGTTYETIYTLPMLTVLMDKGTGVVTSVPSDSPADWRTMQDLKEKPELRKKYGVKDEWILPFDPVEIIDIEGLGKCCAKTVCEEMKIASQNDPQLEEAKNTCYVRGFAKGVMLLGKYAGEKVSEVKPKIAEELIKDGLAFKFADPSDRVVSRSGDECVVCLSDQWYLPYGEDEWLAKATTAVNSMRMYGDERATRKSFNEALDWLHEWAFSRTYGLGTRLPWDPNFLIESLSDSTIYMAYYTFAHLLQGDGLTGANGGPLGIKPEQMTDGAWNYIMALAESGKVPEGCDIPLESLDKMRREFEFWYPYDVRVSGKDLIKNHLTFAMYNHVAIFPESRWPAGVRTNGFLLLNGKKMSKSAGNFLTLKDSIKKYSADATRMALAESGDSLENSNFTHGAANASILRLNKLIDFAKELKEKKDLRDGEFNQRDRVFLAQMDRQITVTTDAFENMNFRDALIASTFDLKVFVDVYIKSTSSIGGMHKDVINKYLEVQVTLLEPLCPHVSQHIWETSLGKEGFVCDAPWPKPELSPAEFTLVMQKEKWADDVVSEVRAKIALEIKNASKKGGKFDCEKVLLVFGKQPAYVVEAEKVLKAAYNPETKSLPPFKELSGEVKKIQCLKGDKKALPMCMKMVKEAAANVEKEGESALQLGLPFEGKEVLLSNDKYITVSLGVKGIEFKEEEEVQEKLPHKRILSVKGRPVTATIYLVPKE